jgi:hypothetical protein
VREEAVHRRAKQETKSVARSGAPRIALLGVVAGMFGGALWIAAGPAVGQAKREAPLALDGPWCPTVLSSELVK